MSAPRGASSSLAGDTPWIVATCSPASAPPPPGRPCRASPAPRGEPTRIVFWHAMSAANGEEVARIARDFNASQSDVVLDAVYKGTYPETLTAAIAAYRAGQAPHIAQVFEVGTGTMLQAGPAIKPAWKLAEETGFALDPKSYVPGVRGYYSLPDGRLASMPFNSSTAIMWYNKDAFEKAGLDPEKPPVTYADFDGAARILASKASDTHRLHHGLDALDPVRRIRRDPEPPLRHRGGRLRRTRRPAPRQRQALRGPAAALHGPQQGRRPSSIRAAIRRRTPSSIRARPRSASALRRAAPTSSRMRPSATERPCCPPSRSLNPKPDNSIIGGASLWALTAPSRTDAEYRAVARFYAFISKPEQVALYAQHTGYVPVTTAGFDITRAVWLLRQEPGHRAAREAARARRAHAELAGPAPRPPARDPRRHLRGDREDAAGPADRAGPPSIRRSSAATACCATSRSPRAADARAPEIAWSAGRCSRGGSCPPSSSCRSSRSRRCSSCGPPRRPSGSAPGARMPSGPARPSSGLENFADLFADPLYVASIERTALFCVA